MTQTVVEATALEPKEKILAETRPNIIPAIMNFENLGLIGFLIMALILSFFFRFGFSEILIIGGLWLLVAFPSFGKIFRFGSTNYVLTNRRLVIFFISLKENQDVIPLSEITSAECKQSGLQRFSGGGDVVVKRRGLKKSIRLQALTNCKQFAKQINQAAKNYG